MVNNTSIRYSVIIILLIAILIMLNCEKNEDEISTNVWIKGLWTSSENDSLCFSTFLIINNSLPFDYNFDEDTMSLFPIQSSNLNDWRHYYYELDRNKNILILDGLLDSTRRELNRQNYNCKLY